MCLSRLFLFASMTQALHIKHTHSDITWMTWQRQKSLPTLCENDRSSIFLSLAISIIFILLQHIKTCNANTTDLQSQLHTPLLSAQQNLVCHVVSINHGACTDFRICQLIGLLGSRLVGHFCRMTN